MGMGIGLIHGDGNGKEWEFLLHGNGRQWKCKKNSFSIISTPQESVSSPAFGAKSDTKQHGNNSPDTHKTIRNTYTHSHVTENDTLSFFSIK